MAHRKRTAKISHPALFDRNPMPMWVCDLDLLSFLAVNTAALRFYGYSRREFLAMTIHDIHPPEDIPALVEHMDRTVEGHSRSGAWRHRKKDGTVVDVEIVTHALRFNGRYARLALIVDVTAREHLQHSLEAVAAEWRSTFDSIGDAIALLNADGNVIRCNRALTLLTGKDYDEIIGRHCGEILSDELEPLAGCLVEEVLATHQRATSQLVLLSRAFQVTADPIFDGTGRFVGAVHIITDTSRQERAEKTIRASAGLLEAISRVQSGFIVGQPPAAIFGRLLESILTLTRSAYGFVGEVLSDEEGSPYLRTHSISDVAWDEASRAMYEAHAPHFEFRNLRTLFGEVLLTGRTVISNTPAEDPRRGGLPPGHPALDSFLGLPLRLGGVLVGMVGIANRPGGYDQETVEFLQPLLATCSSIIEAFRNDTRRRKAEEAVRSNEERLRVIFDGTHEGILIADPRTKRFVFGNRGICAMLGYRTEEIASLGVSDIHPRESLPHVLDQFEKQARGEIEVAEGLPIKRRDGSVFYADIKATTVSISGESRIVGFFSDITERHAAEAAVQERVVLAEFERDIGHALNESATLRETLRACTDLMVRHLEASCCCIWTLSSGGDGLELQACSGRQGLPDAPQVSIPLDSPLEIATIARTGRPILINPSGGDGDGECGIARSARSFAGYPLIVAGRLVGAMAYSSSRHLTDIVLTALETAAGSIAPGIERIQSDESLKNYSAQLAALNSASNRLLSLANLGDLYDGICFSAEVVFGADLVWLGLTSEGTAEIPVTASAGACTDYLEGLRVTWDESPAGNGPTGMAIKTATPQLASRDSHEFAPWSVAAERAGLESSLAVPLIASAGHGTCFGSLNFYSRRPDFFSQDRVRLCQIFTNQAAIAIENTRLVGGLEREVAARTGELLSANRELGENIAKLKKLETLRDSLVHMVVHDLRNPLAAVSGFLFILHEEERERLSGKGLKHLGRAMKATDYLTDMVGTVLDISKLEAGRMELRLEDCDLAAIAREVLSQLEALQGKRELRLDAPGQPVTVRGDRQLLFRLMQNLAGNALQFTSDALGRVGIGLQAGATSVRVVVSDNGPGIPPEDQERVFEKYWQSESRSENRGVSTGLGLAFCRLVVEAHGGSIGVESEVGRGSAFWFELPLRGTGTGSIEDCGS